MVGSGVQQRLLPYKKPCLECAMHPIPSFITESPDQPPITEVSVFEAHTRFMEHKKQVEAGRKRKWKVKML